MCKDLEKCCLELEECKSELREMQNSCSNLTSLISNQSNRLILLEAMFNSIPDIFIVKDLEYNIKNANQSALLLGKHYGVESAEKCYELLGRDSVCPFCIENNLDNCDSNTIEHHLEDRDQWLEISLTKLTDDMGRVNGVIEHIRDITVKKREALALKKSYDEIEEAIKKRTSELDESNRMLQQEVSMRKKAQVESDRSNEAKGRFLSHTSHEIRTPMSSIMGMSELLMKSSLTEDQRHYVEIIDESSRALLNLVNDVLDFSKIEAGKLDLEEIPLNIRQVAEGAMRLLRLNAEKKGVELITSIDSRVPDEILGDPGRIRQVLINLVSNALKFTEKGSVTLSISLKSEASDSITLSFYIEDTGIGISPEKVTTALLKSFPSHAFSRILPCPL
jgi:signal transduction histidine kinase